MNRALSRVVISCTMLLIGSVCPARQEDIVVKPGRGYPLGLSKKVQILSNKAAKMEWTVGTSKGKGGRPNEVRDDLSGEIERFLIYDTAGIPYLADWVEFNLGPGANTTDKIRVTRTIIGDKAKFVWADANGDHVYDKCDHKKVTIPKCIDDGIPKLLVDNDADWIIGQYTDRLRPIAIVVSKVEMKGK